MKPLVRRPDRTDAARLVLVVAVVLGALGTVSAGGSASAVSWVPVPETGARGGLVLERDDSRTGSLAVLSPGEPVRWQIRTAVDHHADTVLDLELRKDGDLAAAPRGLEITVSACDQVWTDIEAAPGCPGAAEHVTWAAPRHDYRENSPTFRIPDTRGDSEVFLLVELALPATAEAAADESLMGLTASVAIGVTATDTPAEAAPTTEPAPDHASALVDDTAVSGDDRAASTVPPRLAWTGGPAAPAVLLGSAVVLLGIAALLSRPRRDAT